MEKDNPERQFIVSSEIFSGYSFNVSLYDISTIEDIISLLKKNLINIFNQHNLVGLEKLVNETDFHIHTHTIEEILTSNEEMVFYICDHC